MLEDVKAVVAETVAIAVVAAQEAVLGDAVVDVLDVIHHAIQTV